jgi:PTH1 family peptidyl-tRNA hydrolase
MNKEFKALIGLGNPGKEYEQTYHNAGIIFLDYLANICGAKKSKKPPGKNFAYRNIGNILFIESKKYMNNSGEAVLEAMKYFKLKPEEILIIHDDSDLNLGKWKISKESGAAGHKGVNSVINALKTKKIKRLRIGIRPIEVGRRMKAGEFVLKKINQEDKVILEKTLAEIADYIIKQFLIGRVEFVAKS